MITEITTDNSEQTMITPIRAPITAYKLEDELDMSESFNDPTNQNTMYHRLIQLYFVVLVVT